jgi:hypothetical protein
MPDMLLDMFDVAGEWEQSIPEHQRYGRRPLLVVLGLAGPRIIEALQVERGGYGVGTGEMRGGRKTAAGRDRLFELSAFVTALKWTMGQLGHEDARMSAAVYAQGAQRSRIDYELVWTLMRFADEPEHWADRHVPRAAFGPRIDPTARKRTSTNRRKSDGRGWFRTTDLSRVKQQPAGRKTARCHATWAISHQQHRARIRCSVPRCAGFWPMNRPTRSGRYRACRSPHPSGSSVKRINIHTRSRSMRRRCSPCA